MASGKALKVPLNPSWGEAVSGSVVFGMFSGVMVSVVAA